MNSIESDKKYFGTELIPCWHCNGTGQIEILTITKEGLIAKAKDIAKLLEQSKTIGAKTGEE